MSQQSVKYGVLREKILGKDPGNILAQIFRDIVIDLNMVDDMSTIIEMRLEELKRDGSVKVSKGTLNSKVLTEDMTFKVFIDNVVNILKIEDLEFTTMCKLGKRESISSLKIGIRR